MFEINVNGYWVKPIIISSYSEKFLMERFFNEISKFEFHEKHIYKESYNDTNDLCKTAVVLLIGEKDKKELKRKYSELKALCSDVTLSPYAISVYPLPTELKELPFPNFVLPNRAAERIEEFKLT